MTWLPLKYIFVAQFYCLPSDLEQANNAGTGMKFYNFFIFYFYISITTYCV